MSATFDRLSKLPWTAVEIGRLKTAAEAALRRGMTQPQIADGAGISRATLQRTLAGQNPGWDRLQSIVDTIGVPIEAILGDPTADQGETVEVPIADIHVAAGSGRFALDEAIVATWPFPRRWIEENWPRAELRVVYVSGDSQEPVLRDGDPVLIDVRPTRGADGMHVVRLDDALMIKRVQFEGSQVKLKSHNPNYDDIIVNLASDLDRFAIVGRAVAAVKSL